MAADDGDVMDRIPCLADHVHYRDYPKGLLTDSGVALNATAAHILRACDGQRTVRAIARDYRGRYCLSESEAAADTWEVLEALERHGVLAWRTYR